MMPGANEVCEADVDIGRLLIFGKLQYIFNTH